MKMVGMLLVLKDMIEINILGANGFATYIFNYPLVTVIDWLQFIGIFGKMIRLLIHESRYCKISALFSHIMRSPCKFYWLTVY